MTQSEIKATISKARKAKKITMETMAKNMGVSRQTYSEYEKGKCTIPQLQDILEMVGLKLIVAKPMRRAITEGYFEIKENDISPLR